MLFLCHCTRLGISQRDAVKKGEKKKLYTAQGHGQEGTHVFTTQHVNY